ncbi:unnamed protein product [Arctia plantaginis]|uniref:HTH psq-type domain-containing protein n=1 Tax=Arctia plantaginis TaxID=874455 RepID=A0A8S0ZHL9_ARCPL|nr:unnamed protein product [Arctia plantaginis]
MLTEWNISNDQVHCMIRDEGSNMKRAMRLAKFQDLDCAVKMQLAILACYCFKLFKLTRKYEGEIDPILPEEWKIIECCVELLKPFEEATRELSSSQTLISSVISIIRMLTQKVNDYLTASPESRIHHAATTLKAEKRLTDLGQGKFSTLLEEDNLYVIATYLDPRYKNKFFTSVTEEKIKDDILKISRNTKDILASQTISPTSPSTKRTKKMKMRDSMETDTERSGTSGTGRQSCLISDLAMMLDSSSDDESQETPEIVSPDAILKKELLTFRNKKRINLNESPLKCSLASEYGVGRFTIYDIKKNHQKIKQFVSTTDCAPGKRQTLKKAEHPEVEEALYMWFLQERNRHAPISVRLNNIIYADLKRQKFSVMIDESTDIAAIKTMCVVVRYFCPGKGLIVSRFWDLIQIYGNENTDHVMAAVSLLDPDNCVDTSKRPESLQRIFELLPRLVPKCLNEQQQIDDQWRKLPSLINKADSSQAPDVFWNQILLKEDYLKLANFMLEILSLPNSNAECERKLSEINDIKTKKRNRLITNTIKGVILARQSILRNSANCINYNPNEKMMKTFTDKIYKNEPLSDSDTDID